MDSDELDLATLARQHADENTARAFLESLRWPDGAVCPHCTNKGAYALAPQPQSRRPVRNGVWKCKSCRKQFTVRVGTFFEGSHIPISKWVMAVSIICASRTGIGPRQLQTTLGLSYKSAWSMSHQVRRAMVEPPLRRLPPATDERERALKEATQQRRKNASRLSLAPMSLEDALLALLKIHPPPQVPTNEDFPVPDQC
ncbi:MAG: IS1595 family transposase [Verrucomicrobiia bacterium]|jgi:transposase-like protein